MQHCMHNLIIVMYYLTMQTFERTKLYIHQKFFAQNFPLEIEMKYVAFAFVKLGMDFAVLLHKNNLYLT